MFGVKFGYSVLRYTFQPRALERRVREAVRQQDRQPQKLAALTKIDSIDPQALAVDHLTFAKLSGRSTDPRVSAFGKDLRSLAISPDQGVSEACRQGRDSAIRYYRNKADIRPIAQVGCFLALLAGVVGASLLGAIAAPLGLCALAAGAFWFFVWLSVSSRTEHAEARFSSLLSLEAHVYASEREWSYEERLDRVIVGARIDAVKKSLLELREAQKKLDNIVFKWAHVRSQVAEDRLEKLTSKISKLSKRTSQLTSNAMGQKVKTTGALPSDPELQTEKATRKYFCGDASSRLPQPEVDPKMTRWRQTWMKEAHNISNAVDSLSVEVVMAEVQKNALEFQFLFREGSNLQRNKKLQKLMNDVQILEEVADWSEAAMINLFEGKDSYERRPQNKEPQTAMTIG